MMNERISSPARRQPPHKWGSKIMGLFGLVILTACSSGEDANSPQTPEPPEVPASDSLVPAPPETPDIRRISDIDFASYSRDLAKFVDIEIGQTMSEAVPIIEKHFVPKGGTAKEFKEYSVKNSPAQTETSYSTFEAEGAKVILVERINMRDDSVAAQQFYAIGKKNTDGTETIIDYGMKIKCARGANQGEWGTKLCP